MRRSCLTLLALMIWPLMIWVDGPVADWVATRAIRLADSTGVFSIMLIGLGAVWVAAAVMVALAVPARPTRLRSADPLKLSGRTATLVLGSAAASLGAATLLKHLIGRMRPSAPGADAWRFEPLSIDDRFAALPSAQAACVAAIVLSLAVQLPRWRLPLVASGAAACLARVLAGAHWPSDVVAGWVLGAAMVLVTELGLVRRQTRLGSPPPKRPVREQAGLPASLPPMSAARPAPDRATGPKPSAHTRPSAAPDGGRGA